MNTELQYLEALCKQLYESTDPAERSHAEKSLAEVTERTDCIAKCMMLLEQSNIPYSQLVASTTLIKVISRQTVGVTVEEKLQIKEYLLQHLATHTSFPSYVISNLCQLFARLTKLSWFDLIANDFVFQTSIPTIIGWVEQNQVQVCSVGVQLLVSLTAEMNQQDGVSGISRHRKIAGSFRDTHLYDIFQLSLRLLQQALAGVANFNFSDEAQRGVLSGVLQLAINVLNYDFLGTVIDDSSDDNVTVQIPASWRPAFDSSIIKMCFDLYMHLPTDLGALVLTCLVHLTSVRRTIFTAADRQVYLTAIIAGIGAVLENPQSLNDQGTYHEFCRLVARLKSNFQLVELTKVEGYASIIRRLAEFTTQSLQMPQFSANSVHYLLIFWHRMISSMPYVKPSEPHFIEQYAPLIAKTFIESRINMVSIVAREGIDDPLDDQSTLIQQMEQFSIIGRCEYDKTCQILKHLFDQYASDYQRAVATNDQLNQTLEEWRLTWMVYLIGAAVGGRQASNVSDEHDVFDGDLICRALELMRLTDNRMVTNIRPNEKLEMSYLWFMEQFRKIYISDQVQKSSKVRNKISDSLETPNVGLKSVSSGHFGRCKLVVFTKLTEILHLVDEASILALIVQKIINNFKYWGHNEAVVDSSLSLFNDLSLGYSSVRRLIRLPEIQYLITHHTSSVHGVDGGVQKKCLPEEFSFLGPTADLKTMHCRTTFYSSLSRLLCVEMGEDEGQFERFMTPLTNDLMSKLQRADESLKPIRDRLGANSTMK
uniref:Importin N-terminal domain-containing protein n=1 Tax=Romanomermis culicivorax TaxID=13658 RepID=A0A915JI35_ROMCU